MVPRFARSRSALRSSRVYPIYVRAKYRISSRARSELFSGFFQDNIWGSRESASGSGSTVAATAAIRDALPELLGSLHVRSLLDVPCGDFAWMQHVDLSEIEYTGGDIVPDLVSDLQRRFGGPGRRFVHLDVCSASVPEADAILIRDLFIHLPNALVRKALANVRRSRVKWLIASHYPATSHNADVRLGEHRFLNLTLPPFELPDPLHLLSDSDIERPDKSLGVWPVAALG